MKIHTIDVANNSRETANILNSYFASVYTKEPPDEIPKLAHRKAPKQSKMKITVEMVKRFLHDLNIHKSPGPDGIHPRFMQELSAELCIPFFFEKKIYFTQRNKSTKNYIPILQNLYTHTMEMQYIIYMQEACGPPHIDHYRSKLCSLYTSNDQL